MQKPTTQKSILYNFCKKKIINYIPWALLAILVGLFVAQSFYLESTLQDARELKQEIKKLRAEQDYNKSLLEAKQTPPSELAFQTAAQINTSISVYPETRTMSSSYEVRYVNTNQFT